MKLQTSLAYCLIVITALLLLFVSCSEQKTSVTINQHTDPSHVTGITKYKEALYCATKGGLVKWDLSTKEFKIITTANGLPSNILTDIIVDGNDILWIGSREGLGMFDGNSWKIYGLSQGLPSPDITDLALDSSGNLWVGTMDGAASFEKGNFKLLAEKGSPGRKKIECLYFDKGENLWIGTDNSGIYIKMDDEWILSNKSKGLPGNTASTITQAWNLRIWAASWIGMSSWDGTGWNMYSSLDKMGTIEARYLTSTDDRLWFFTANGVHSSRALDWIHFTEEQGLLSNDVTAGLVESDKMLYVGSVDGLSVIKDGTIDNYVIPNKPVGSNFISIAFDDRNRSWVGSWETGVSLYDSGSWIPITGEKKDTLATVRSIVFGPDGTVVFNTVNGLIFHKEGKWKSYKRNDGLSGDDVRCGVFDNEGRYWAGTSTGICYLENGKWKRFRSIHGLPSEDTWAGGIDSKGTVWFATTGGIVSFVDNKLQDRTHETGLEEVDARSLFIQGDKVYFGTSSGNLVVHDGEKWDVYSNKYLKTDKGILSITSDPSGALWLGTDGDGIIRFENGNTMNLTISDGLPSNFVRSVTYNNDVLWGACYGGIVSIKIEKTEE